MVLPEKRIEAYRRVGHAKTGLATIAIDLLRPRNEGTVGLKSAVVLVPALQMLVVVGSNRKALELDGRKSLVQIEEVRWYRR